MNIETRIMEQFFYHKIDNGNRLAEQYLSKNNPLGRPAAVIFFGQVTLEDIRAGRVSADAQAFVETPDHDWDKTCIIVVGKKAWFLKPAGHVIDVRGKDLSGYLRNSEDDSTQKLMPIEVIEERELTEIPYVLASVNSNQYLVRGTYRRLSETRNRGNLKAIFTVLGKTWKSEWYETNDASGLFECLSSVELETLVAKILEEYECFVPAHRGGTLKDVDLFAYRDRPLNIDGLNIDKNGIQIQVKGGAHLSPSELSDGVSLIGYACSGIDYYFNEDWLINQIRQLPKTKAWLEQSLWWVPNDFVRMFL